LGWIATWVTSLVTRTTRLRVSRWCS